MRYSEYEKFDPGDFESISGSAPVGNLGIITADGYPRVVPVNFVAVEKKIYFHGAAHGEKYELLKDSPPVTFSIYIPYSIIPSYWIHKDNAGGATMFFKSLLYKGRCRIVDGLNEKTDMLQRLMEKYQPEGGFLPVTSEEPQYRELLGRTMVFRIDADRIHLRVKFHQKKDNAYKMKLIRHLEQRRQGPDLATAEVLRGMLEQDKKTPE
jgi:nitroimidazol reductase NimA-like FMN-containing flavoprotein (pyridoxamine 5'-phosphate oxidase superfamily)